VREADGDEDLGLDLGHRLAGLRRVKDEEELRRMRTAVRATAAGFEEVRGLIRPGLTERRVEVDLQAAMFRAGGDRIAFETIVAAGPRAAVLHAMPSDRVLAAGEMVLIDAGVECRGYAADVSRTWPVEGAFTPEQADLYAVVLETVKTATALCRAGTEFREVHLAACEVVARGLADMGLLRGDAASLVEQDAPSLFFPHGVGHMVGLGVRGAGGTLPGRERSDRPCLEYLRTDLPLEVGFTVTIEPGLYFIPALLRDPDKRKRWSVQVDWDRVDRMLEFGGIRIEDNVLVTGGEPEVLTSAIPKEI
jgi:Xaa-Pro aminopeptidase